MTEPAPEVSAFTARAYGELADCRRDPDPALGYPLLRYLSLVADQGGDVEALTDRITDLADPARADVGWLPWLAQAIGGRITPTASEEERRAALSTAAGGFRAGSRAGLAELARTALTGTRYVSIVPHLGGDPLTIGLSTLEEETPDLDAVVAAITDAGAKPAGYDLVVTFYTASWDTIETAYPTSAAVDAVPSWTDLEQTT